MSKTLVAYFSASGITAGLAKTMAVVSGADLLEIVPQNAYTTADLDWQNKQSRSSLETADPAARPSIAGKVTDMGQYDTILLGFPIWWYVAPKIINTFLEQYDLAGKTIIPFATSGGSEMGETNAALTPSCPGAKLVEGKKFSPKATEAELKSWLESVR